MACLGFNTGFRCSHAGRMAGSLQPTPTTVVGLGVGGSPCCNLRAPVGANQGFVGGYGGTMRLNRTSRTTSG